MAGGDGGSLKYWLRPGGASTFNSAFHHQRHYYRTYINKVMDLKYCITRFSLLGTTKIIPGLKWK